MAPRNTAIEAAEALFAAAGRARGRASAATVPFNPPLENLRYVWLLYCWSTRSQGRQHAAYYRDAARNAVRNLRALRAQDAGERRQRRAA